MNSYRIVFVLTILSVSFLGCTTLQQEPRSSTTKADERIEPAPQFTENAATRPARDALAKVADRKDIARVRYQESEIATPPLDRKIISNADITIEVSSPSEAQWKIRSIAANSGGFVVTSEARQRENVEPTPQLDVILVLRVPSPQFETVLTDIRASGGRVLQEKISGQDVTEEFVDLVARIKTQKALETQFLEIMKRASAVPDALEVQRQIAEVRTEIEKLEGRRRFLENRTSFSTISINFRTPAAVVVNASGFGRSIREAMATSIDIATGIVLLLIRSVIVLTPIVLFIGLPGVLIARYVVRKVRSVPELETVTPAE